MTIMNYWISMTLKTLLHQIPKLLRSYSMVFKDLEMDTFFKDFQQSVATLSLAPLHTTAYFKYK